MQAGGAAVHMPVLVLHFAPCPHWVSFAQDWRHMPLVSSQP